MRRVLGALFLCVACGAPPAAENASQGVVGPGAVFAEITRSALGAQPCGPGLTEGCYSNYVAVADLDGDGALDLVFANGGDHFVPGQAVASLVAFGDGHGYFRDGSARFPGLAPSHVRQAAIGDVDGDGRLDLYLPGGYGLDADQLFLQKPDGTFADEAYARLGGRASRAGGAHFGDIDGDGDLDLLVIDWGDQPNDNDPEKRPLSPVAIDVLVNDGKGTFAKAARLDAPQGSAATDVELYDLDGDFDLDVLLDNRNGQARLYLNDGRGQFEDVTAPSGIPGKKDAISFNAEACDIDGDGDLDLLFDGAANDTKGQDTQILVNDGKAHFADESAKRLGKEVGSDDNQVKCADVDGDGDYDLVVASLSEKSEKLFLNGGGGVFGQAFSRMPQVEDPTLGVDVGDFDGDGALDLVTAQGEDPKAPWLNRVYRNVSGARDARPPVFRAVEAPYAAAGAPIVLRAAIADAYTSQAGQAIREVTARVTVNGGYVEVAGRFVGGDLYRFELPAQTAGALVASSPSPSRPPIAPATVRARRL